MPPVVRFAPSPTGRIHIGNARTALINFLFVKKDRGQFILRFDDTDLARSKDEYATAIAQDLHWLGIVPDHVVHQSQQFVLYDVAAAKLRALGRLYPCYETAEELERRRKRQQARGLPPIYDRAALTLTQADRAALEAAGRRPHWRFLLDHVVVHWDDLVRGPSHIDCASLSDPILVREDGTYLYTLPSVVDDLDLEISHIIRGEDHVTNTAVQIQLFEALGGAGAAPVFGHHNLLTTASGEGLSKRSGALSLTTLHEEGIEFSCGRCLRGADRHLGIRASGAIARGARGTVRFLPGQPQSGAIRSGGTENALRAYVAPDGCPGGIGPSRGGGHFGAEGGSFLARRARQS